MVDASSDQARNQLGTLGGAKSFLKGTQIFSLRKIVLKYVVQHTFPGEAKTPLRPPYLRPWFRCSKFTVSPVAIAPLLSNLLAYSDRCAREVGHVRKSAVLFIAKNFPKLCALFCHI